MGIVVADSWRAVHPDARVGVLALRTVRTPARHDLLDARRDALEASLRARFAGWSRAQLSELETIRAYSALYRAFGPPYHVPLPLASVALAHHARRGGEGRGHAGQGFVVPAMRLAIFRRAGLRPTRRRHPDLGSARRPFVLATLPRGGQWQGRPRRDGSEPPVTRWSSARESRRSFSISCCRCATPFLTVTATTPHCRSPA